MAGASQPATGVPKARRCLSSPPKIGEKGSDFAARSQGAPGGFAATLHWTRGEKNRMESYGYGHLAFFFSFRLAQSGRWDCRMVRQATTQRIVRREVHREARTAFLQDGTWACAANPPAVLCVGEPRLGCAWRGASQPAKRGGRRLKSLRDFPPVGEAAGRARGSLLRPPAGGLVRPDFRVMRPPQERGDEIGRD